MKNRSLVEDISELNDVIQSFVQAKLDLWKIVFLQKITRLGTYLLSTMIIAIVLLVVSVFLTLAFTQWYSNSVGTLSEAYLIASGFYVAVGVIIYLFRKSLFSNMMVRNIASIIFSDEDDENRN